MSRRPLIQYILRGPGLPAMIFVGALVLVGVFGAFFVLGEGSSGDNASSRVVSIEEEFKWLDTYEEGRERAEATGRPLIVDFMADWCVACKEMEEEVFADPEIRERLRTEFVAVKINYDRADSPTQLAIMRFAVSSLPRVAFESAEGTFLRGASFEEKIDIADFEARLDEVVAGGGE